jgi:uncharacterized membrane protein
MMSKTAFRNSPSSRSEEWLDAVIFSEGTRCAHLIPRYFERHQASVHILRLPSAMYSSYSLAVRGYGLLARLQRGEVGTLHVSVYTLPQMCVVCTHVMGGVGAWIFGFLFFVGGSFVLKI